MARPSSGGDPPHLPTDPRATDDDTGRQAPQPAEDPSAAALEPTGLAVVAPTDLPELIDLRDQPAVIDLTDGSRVRRPSGRPADLLPGHRLVTVDGGDDWMKVEAFVYDIYRRIGYCEDSPRHRVEELARWNDRSRFQAVIDDDGDGEVIGVVRSIFGPYAELPVGQFTRTDDRDPDPVSELSSLTVRTDVRSTGVIEHLYRAGWLDALRSGATTVVALIDQWLLDVFRDIYCLPFSVVGQSRNYMGSEPVPAAMTLQGRAYALTAGQNPEFWAWTLEAVDPSEIRRWDMPRLVEWSRHPVDPSGEVREPPSGRAPG